LHAVLLEDHDALNLPAGRADRVQHFLQQKRGMHFTDARRYISGFPRFVDLGNNTCCARRRRHCRMNADFPQAASPETRH